MIMDGDACEVEMAEPETLNKAAAENGTSNESDLAVISNVLEKLGLNELDTAEEKLNAMCLIFKNNLEENIRLKDERSNITTQLEKTCQTKTALQNLVAALKTQITLTKDEGELRLKEETNKRIESSHHYESTMNDLTQLMESHSGHNGKLREEHALMTQRLTELLGQYEDREKRISGLTQEFGFREQLYEAKLSKAKVEQAEMKADFTKERLEAHKFILEARQENEKLYQKDALMKEQLELYKKQYEDLEKGMGESGAHLGRFRKEMEKLTHKLRKVELETQEWKQKYDVGNEQVKKMNSASLEREKEIATVQKKLSAMTKLNRTLHAERNELMKRSRVEVEQVQPQVDDFKRIQVEQVQPQVDDFKRVEVEQVQPQVDDFKPET